MSGRMPPIPRANRSPKGPFQARVTPKADAPEKNAEPENTSEQGETANIRQNTTNEGFFQGRRVK